MGELPPHNLVPCTSWAREGLWLSDINGRGGCWHQIGFPLPHFYQGMHLLHPASSNDAPAKASINTHVSQGQTAMLAVRVSVQTRNEKGVLP